MSFFILRSNDIRNRCLEEIGELEINERTPYQVEIKEYKHNRTVEQNRRFHWVIRKIAAHVGESVDMMKQIITQQFIGMRAGVDPLTGDVVHYLPSTAGLTTAEFSDLIIQTEALAAELGVAIDENMG